MTRGAELKKKKETEKKGQKRKQTVSEGFENIVFLGDE